MDLAIIAIAYNRPLALKRLLTSLSLACFDDTDVVLYISIDYSGVKDCFKISQEFSWKHGAKRVIRHEQRLGLKDHVISCGDKVYNHDAIVLLEDDLIVSPYFYRFAKQALSTIENSPSVAGIGLYSYSFNEFAGFPFQPIQDGYDNYYMKIPCSLGQVFNRTQWSAFKEAYESNILEFWGGEFVPKNVLRWRQEKSWKKYFYLYMYLYDKYFLYPCVSYSTNLDQQGTNTSGERGDLNVNLNWKNNDFQFVNLEKTINVYDQFFELEKTSQLREYTGKYWDDVEFDLYGLKKLRNLPTNQLILSSKCTSDYELGLEFIYAPQQANIMFGHRYGEPRIPHFKLGKKESFVEKLSDEYVNRLVSMQPPRLRKAMASSGVEDFKKKSMRYKIGDWVLCVIPKLGKSTKEIQSGGNG